MIADLVWVCMLVGEGRFRRPTKAEHTLSDADLRESNDLCFDVYSTREGGGVTMQINCKVYFDPRSRR